MAKYRVEFDSDYDVEEFKKFMTFIGHNSHIKVNKFEHFVETKEEYRYSLTDKGRDYYSFLSGKLSCFDVNNYDEYGNRIEKDYDAEEELYDYLSDCDAEDCDDYDAEEELYDYLSDGDDYDFFDDGYDNDYIPW